MNIAYDLRFAVDHFTGIGTHAASLLAALLDRPDAHHYTVLWNPELGGPPIRRHGHGAPPAGDVGGNDVTAAAPARSAPGGGMAAPACPRRLPQPVLSLPARRPVPRRPDPARHQPDHPADRPVAPRRALFRAALGGARRAGLILTGSEFSAGELGTARGLPAGRVRAIPLGVPRRARRWSRRGRAACRRLHVCHRRRRESAAQEPRGARPRLGAPRPPRRRARRRRAPGCPLSVAGLDGARRRRARLPRPLAGLGERARAGVACTPMPALVLNPRLLRGVRLPDDVEAFDAGVPTVAADISVFREVAQAAAAYAPPDDPRAWAAAIESAARRFRRRGRRSSPPAGSAPRSSVRPDRRGDDAALEDVLAAATTRLPARRPIIAARPHASTDSGA